MEHGDIVIVLRTKQKGIILETDDAMAHILYYDFSTSWIPIDDCQKIGSSDAIFKVMYEIASCEMK